MGKEVKALGKVAVLMGGWSSEREVSLMSGKGVLEALLSVGVDAHAFDPKEQNLFELKKQGFDRCFITLHGALGEDGAVQGALEVLGIPYTGTGVMASAIGMDKVMTKRIWMSQAIPTPAYELIHAHEVGAKRLDEVVEKLGLPLIVKPAQDGSSMGVVKVTQASQMAAAVQEAAKFGEVILCEQFVGGEELTCAVLGRGANARVLPIIRIIAPQGEYNYENKYFSDDTRYECPAALSEQETEKIQGIVLKAYLALGCRGWGRVDVMIDGKTRAPYLLEINTSPGMTSHSLVPMAAQATGVSYAQLCVEMLEAATLDANLRK
ncbi:MAG: D-alanine--D-alanine ligase [Saezia sp.]